MIETPGHYPRCVQMHNRSSGRPPEHTWKGSEQMGVAQMQRRREKKMHFWGPQHKSVLFWYYALAIFPRRLSPAFPIFKMKRGRSKHRKTSGGIKLTFSLFSFLTSSPMSPRPSVSSTHASLSLSFFSYPGSRPRAVRSFLFCTHGDVCRSCLFFFFFPVFLI